MLAAFVLYRSNNSHQTSDYHGPNPNILQDIATDSGTSPSPIPTVSATPAIPTKTQDRAQDQSPNKVKEYGIAAGGVLISLSQNDLDQYFSSLQSLGVKWVRWDIDWSAIQPDNTTDYQWGGTDRVVAIAKRYGINSLGTIAYTPKWAADQSCSAKFQCAPADPKTFGLFAGQVALRYKDSVAYWEIWNEPNYKPFWGSQPDVKKYADILREAYTEIKKENPKTVVISAGLAITGDDQDSPFTYIKTLYALGSNNYFDAVALHPYTYPASPEYKASWNGWQQIKSIHKFMESAGDSNKKIWITEYGAPTGGPGSAHNLNQLSFTYGSDFMSESAQQQIVQQVLSLYNQSPDWMGPFFWYSLHDNGTSKNTPENFFGLMRYDWSKKPAYDVFRNMIYNQ
jgi:hypothetical protein